MNETRPTTSSISPGFHVVVGNPPYQDEKNSPVFDKHQDIALYAGELTSMIYMASRWWYGTSGLSEFRSKQLCSTTLKSVLYFSRKESAKHVFPNVDIAGGLSVVLHAKTPRKNQNKTFTLSEYLTGVSVQVDRTKNFLPIQASGVRLAQRVNLFLNENNCPTVPEMEEIVSNEIAMTAAEVNELNPVAYMGQRVLKNHTKIYANLSGSTGGRSREWIIEKPKHSKKEIDFRYKVVMGQSIVENENRPFRTFILDNKTTFGRSTVALRYFDTMAEANNFLSYTKTVFFEAMTRLTIAGRLRMICSHVPDLSNIKNERTGKIGFASEWTDVDMKELFAEYFEDSDWETMNRIVYNGYKKREDLEGKNKTITKQKAGNDGVKGLL